MGASLNVAMGFQEREGAGKDGARAVPRGGDTFPLTGAPFTVSKWVY